MPKPTITEILSQKTPEEVMQIVEKFSLDPQTVITNVRKELDVLRFKADSLINHLIAKRSRDQGELKEGIVLEAKWDYARNFLKGSQVTITGKVSNEWILDNVTSMGEDQIFQNFKIVGYQDPMEVPF